MDELLSNFKKFARELPYKQASVKKTIGDDEHMSELAHLLFAKPENNTNLAAEALRPAVVECNLHGQATMEEAKGNQNKGNLVTACDHKTTESEIAVRQDRFEGAKPVAMGC